MVMVAKISAEKAKQIKGKYYLPGIFYGPRLDGNNNWFISLEEAETLDPEEYEIIEWVPPIPDDEE